jgi:hypothetical protein
VKAVPPADYAAYLTELQADPDNALTDDPAVTGELLPVVAGTPHPEEEK